MLDSRIDNELAELKRSQAASFDAYKAELREVFRLQGPLIDKTAADVEEARSKIKEIVDYEGHSLQWLIKSIRSAQIMYAGPGGHNYQANVKDFFDKDTPTSPAHLGLSPKCVAGVRPIDLLPKGSEEVPIGSHYYVSLFAPTSEWKKLGFVPTQDIDVPFMHPWLGSVVWRQCLDRTQSAPEYRFFFVPTTRAPPAGSDWHIRASNPAAAAAKK